ncbi:hypothetical protein Mame01_43770 [Microbispora amethystogenes]|nr:hypothetical protein Mame01_43770 [Microbispora amethystogenes]
MASAPDRGRSLSINTANSSVHVEITQVWYSVPMSYVNNHCTKLATEKRGDKIYKWAWGNLKLLMSGAQ